MRASRSSLLSIFCWSLLAVSSASAADTGGLFPSGIPKAASAVITNTIESARFSWDSGHDSTGLITAASRQVISGTILSPLLTGELVEVSVDSGRSWHDAAMVGATNWEVGATLLAGNNLLMAGVKNTTIPAVGPEFSAPYVLEDKPPTLSIASDMAVIGAGATAKLTFTFSVAPSGFSAGDIAAMGGTVSALTATSDPRVYEAFFTPNGYLPGGHAYISVGAGSYTDAAGNNGGGAGVSIAVDTLPPSVMISSSTSSVSLGESTVITFTFSEPITHFSANSLIAIGGTLGTLQRVSSLVYAANLTPDSNQLGGSISVMISAGSYRDEVGNAGLGAMSSPIAVTPLIQASGAAPGVVGSITMGLGGGSTSCTLTSTNFNAPLPAGALAGATLPVGVFAFRATGCSDESLEVKITYPQSLPPGVRFFKYGPPAPGRANTWYELVTGANLILGNDRRTVTYTVADNQAGDSNPMRGVIEDPFAPMLIPAAPTSVASIPTLSHTALVGLGAILALFAWRRRFGKRG
ncbi:MAG: IPTL-CTERM sorting domain-containing protein [Hyphomicrobiales bacterium]|nr:MAG: IPTL-CTERM sorting domain-containing protein [Hyphomicrobiales bacterium]